MLFRFCLMCLIMLNMVFRWFSCGFVWCFYGLPIALRVGSFHGKHWEIMGGGTDGFRHPRIPRLTGRAAGSQVPRAVATWLLVHGSSIKKMGESGMFRMLVVV